MKQVFQEFYNMLKKVSNLITIIYGNNKLMICILTRKLI